MRKILINQTYKHFKGNLYYVIAIATHTETNEKFVIYHSLEHPETIYARPYDMFSSEVDHEKYPGVSQKYRFELVEQAQ